MSGIKDALLGGLLGPEQANLSLGPGPQVPVLSSEDTSQIVVSFPRFAAQRGPGRPVMGGRSYGEWPHPTEPGRNWSGKRGGLGTRFGDKAKALAYLEEAYAERAPQLKGLKVNSDFRTLSSDARFQAIVGASPNQDAGASPTSTPDFLLRASILSRSLVYIPSRSFCCAGK